ncbi:MAG TPA: TIGR04282 family arsenosugar biosynthesis glycosyltransferase [Panacibacter sp.]|nr:TIGR04282 family arsenosugar biosynthesis glycosyltransferase [Panacibacter sp.]
MNTNALIIFVKNPLPGMVKTRLAKTIGAQEAVAVYRQLLLHTYNISIKCNADKFVFYVDFINEDDLWSNGSYQKFLQQGDDFGERILNAFELLFLQGYKKVTIIGSDCIEIETSHLHQAFDFLNDCDVVIGPAQDGGYYLFAMKAMYKQFFLNKNRGTSLLLQQTLKDISELHLTYHLLPVLSDVDEEKDMYLLHHRQ